jgi:hypothetical protein
MRDMFATLNTDSGLSVIRQPDPQPAEAESSEEDEPPNPFPAPGRPAEPSVDLAETSREFVDVVEDYVARFTKLPQAPAILSTDAEAVLLEMTCSGGAEAEVQSLVSSTDRVVLAGIDRLRQHKLEQQIILFHFWSNYGQPSEASQHKAARLREKLKELQDVLLNELRGMVSREAGRLLRPLYQEMNDAFDKVFELE